MANFITLRQIYLQPQVAPRFLIEGLLPASGLTFLVAKPKDGKSTLARQAISAVATGNPFLGFTTKQSSALYLAIEERASEVASHFADMRVPPDAPIEIHTGALEPGWLQELELKLTINREIKLVVIDPLLLAVDVKDANDYAPMMKALSRLRDIARRFEVAILSAHHAKKSVSSDAGDNVLGSTAIRASADATWQMFRLPDGKRTFQTEMRYGTDLPPTNLIFDEDSRVSCLGQAEAAVEKLNAAQIRGRIETEIIRVIASNPMQTRDAIIDAVTGNTGIKYQVFGKLEQQGLLVKSGGGVKGDPYRYELTVPVEAEKNDNSFVEA